jgi:hypothetical protein
LKSEAVKARLKTGQLPVTISTNVCSAGMLAELANHFLAAREAERLGVRAQIKRISSRTAAADRTHAFFLLEERIPLGWHHSIHCLDKLLPQAGAFRLWGGAYII